MAVSLAPAFRTTSRRLGFSARASWLQFESGNSSLQGLAIGSLFFPSVRGPNAELNVELGGSHYEQFSSFSHVLAGARMQFPGTNGVGGWVGGTLGTAAYDSGTQAVSSFRGALLFDGSEGHFSVGGAATAVGGAGYLDFEMGFRRGRPGGFTADAAVGVRAGDPNGDPGPYFEAALSIPLGRNAAVTVSGGRFAADAVRGSVAGNYVTAGLRITGPSRRRSFIALPAPDDVPGDVAPATPALVAMRRGAGNACTLVFAAAGPSPVEVMADFTDWVATPLKPEGPNRWTVTLPIAPGRHRLNVRVGGGAWVVPAGTTPAPDDFEGMAGAVVIP